MQLGDKVRITGLPEHTKSYISYFNQIKSSDAERRARVVVGKIVHFTPIHFTVDNGRYRESFLFQEYPNLRRRRDEN
jgi:hypothetical protein